MITRQEDGRSRRARSEAPQSGPEWAGNGEANGSLMPRSSGSIVRDLSEIGSDNSPWTAFDTVAIGRFAVATATRQQLVDAAVADCRAAHARGGHASPRLVFDVNGQALSLSESDLAYRAAVASADVIHADGAFVVTASRIPGGRRIAERSATTDMIHDFAARAAREGLSFYLLGGTEEVNALCARRLVDLYPGLRIAGRRNGFFSSSQAETIVEEITAVAPDFLWVGLGKPKEQVFAVAWRDRIRAGWLITCGGCFNFISGHYRRAPKWMQDANLEWLHRLATDPRRLFWRYLVTTPHALWLVLWSR